jgi:hypothetical protein
VVGGKEILRVERWIAIELKGVAVESVGAGFW